MAPAFLRRADPTRHRSAGVCRSHCLWYPTTRNDAPPAMFPWITTFEGANCTCEPLYAVGTWEAVCENATQGSWDVGLGSSPGGRASGSCRRSLACIRGDDTLSSGCPAV